MFSDIRMVFYGATTYLNSIIISAVSMNRYSHSGIQFKSDDPFTVKGITYAPGVYITHATEQNSFKGVHIQLLENVEFYYSIISKHMILGVNADVLSNRLQELMDHWAYTDYSVMSLLNPFYWNVDKPTYGIGVICTTYQLIYLQSIMPGYTKVYVISPAKLQSTLLNDTIRFRQTVLYSEKNFNHTLSVALVYVIIFAMLLLTFLLYGYVKARLIYSITL